MSRSDDVFIYCLHGVSEGAGFIVCASLDETTVYKEACITMLREMVETFGKPSKIEKADDLDDQDTFNNQQVVAAFDCYGNTDTTSTGELRMNWNDRYRRIDSIYEKLGSIEAKKGPTFKNSYYVSKVKNHSFNSISK